MIFLLFGRSEIEMKKEIWCIFSKWHKHFCKSYIFRSHL